MKKLIKKQTITLKKVARFVSRAFNEGRKENINYDFDSRVYWP